MTRIKKKIQLWMAFEAKMAYKIGLTPNRVSVLGTFFAILSSLAYWKWQLHQFLQILAFILLLASGFCDALDGVLARLYGESTTFGGFIDSIFDRYSDAIILSGIILGGLCNPFLGLTALMGSLLVSYTRSRAEAERVEMETVGIAERAERILILAIASFLAIVWLEALNWGIAILAILTNLTVIQRVIYFHKAVTFRKDNAD